MRKLTIFILTIFTVATLYAAARPSLDGRAVVADAGTMPRGLFARTVGYLPGDSVTVTNPATGSTIDVLVLGAIDPSEGVAILLSPEAAEGLRIKPESNVQVKLTKRAGSLDENANGSAILSEEEEKTPEPEEAASAGSDIDGEEDNAPDYEEIPAIAEKSEEPENIQPETEKVAKKAVEPAEEPKPAYEEVAATLEEEIPEIEKETVIETPVIAEKPVESKTEEELETVYEDLPPLPQDEKLQKVVVVEAETEDRDEPVEEVKVKVEEIPATSQAEEEKLQPVVVVEEVPAVTEEEKVEVVQEQVPAVVEEKALAEEIVTESAPVIEEEKESTLVYSEELPPVEEELPAGVESEPAVVAEESSVESEEDDMYQPIVLIPSESNPPVVTEKTEPVEEKMPEEPVKAEKVEVLAEAEKEAPPAKETKPAETEKTVKVVVSNEWTNYVVPSLKNLRSGFYYVQVASLANYDNIKSFVDKYSAKYPVVLVQNSSKSAYQVMVGPLNIDEYGSVGEKFKAYGFKDSFVRKIR